jgi:hypothetical protein
MHHRKRSARWADDRADHERSIGIPDRDPIVDTRDVVPMDLSRHGGKRWQIEPRLGYTSCRVRDMDTEAVECVGTMKQCLRWMSRQVAHRLGARALQ